MTVALELPGVDKNDLEISLENGVLRIEGRINFARYEGLDRRANGAAIPVVETAIAVVILAAVFGWFIA